MRSTMSRVHIRAPRATVWAVLTDPVHVKQWQYGSDLTTDWAIGSPIRFSAVWEGGSFEQWGTVLQFDAPERLRYSLFAPRPDVEDRPENYFTMTYTLTDDAGATDLAITQDDPRDIPADDDPDDGENPVLAALRALAESL